jgi:hypothetical protein
MYEGKFIEEGIDEEEVTKKRLEMFYDYYCRNLKLISTETVYTNIKKYEKFIHGTGLVIDEEKVIQKIKISLGIKKQISYLMNSTQNLVYLMKREKT